MSRTLNVTKIVFATGACLLIALPAAAQVLFDESFTGAALDAAKWAAVQKAGVVTRDNGLRLQNKSPGEAIAWNQLFVLGRSAVPRGGRTAITYEVEWNNLWFLVGLAPAGKPFSAWETDLRLGFHLHGPQLWAVTNAKDFGRGILVGQWGVSGDGPGRIKLRITLGAVRGARFEYDAGQGWQLARDTRDDPRADDSKGYCPVFLLSRSDTGRPDCHLKIKRVSAQIVDEPPPPSPADQSEEPVPGRIVYVRQQIPAVPIPPYRGETYEDTVPDTYDVAERARLAIRVLTAAVNPRADYEQYFLVSFGRNPVVMTNDFNDWCQLKYMEALPLLRIVTGDTANQAVDRVWTDVTLKSIGPDGLFYIPLEGRPWGRSGVCWGDNGVARADGSFTHFNDPTVKQFSHPFSCGRSISIMTVYHLRDGNAVWTEAGRRMIDRLLQLAIHKDDYCYFPALMYEPNARYDPKSAQAAMPKAILGGEINGRVIQAAARFYKLTRYEPAKTLAAKQTSFMRFHDDYFGPNGEFLAERHFHAHTIYLLGMLEHARAAGDKELVEFVRKSYTWAKTPAAGSSSLLGFFPEIAKPDYLSCESCEIADMIALALKLSEAGAGDYYADAERWTRNHFAESQLVDYEWIERAARQRPRADGLAYHEAGYRTAERNAGAFAGWSAANDWWVQGPGIMHCCTGNAARTLYYIWQHTLDHREGELRVHMLLNRASPWADIYCHIPYEGRVDVKLKKPCKRLLVHAPEWIQTGSGQVTAAVQTASRPIHWQGRYMDLGSVDAGQTAQVKFPIPEQTVKETIGTIPYTLVVKGNTVVAIDPAGKNCPLYQRDHYRQGQVRWRKVNRFVSTETIDY